MRMLIGETLLGLILIYLTCGLVFGVAFVAIGVGRLDEAAHGTSITFRLLILPGTIVFWPLLAAWWLKISWQGRNP
jgi:hypothetical protein